MALRVIKRLMLLLRARGRGLGCVDLLDVVYLVLLFLFLMRDLACSSVIETPSLITYFVSDLGGSRCGDDVS